MSLEISFTVQYTTHKQKSDQTESYINPGYNNRTENPKSVEVRQQSTQSQTRVDSSGHIILELQKRFVSTIKLDKII